MAAVTFILLLSKSILVSVSPWCIILSATYMLLAKVETPAILTLSKFVWPSTSKSALQSIPSLAVIIPTESILVTSSYVSTPPTETLPVNVADDPFIAPPKVVTPAMLTLSKFVWPSTSKSPDKLGLPPILPTKLEAVIIPEALILLTSNPVECRFWVWNWRPWVCPRVNAVPTLTTLLSIVF